METGTITNNIKNIFKGVGIALLTTIILLLIYSLVLTYTNVSENTITPVIIVITATCILLGSSIGNMKIFLIDFAGYGIAYYKTISIIYRRYPLLIIFNLKFNISQNSIQFFFSIMTSVHEIYIIFFAFFF